MIQKTNVLFFFANRGSPTEKPPFASLHRSNRQGQFLTQRPAEGSKPNVTGKPEKTAKMN
jgi:hypothetical protein